MCGGFVDQEERSRSVEAFRKHEKDVLVATDVASKGLDFPDIQHVINYDMPDDVENYGKSFMNRPTGECTDFVLIFVQCIGLVGLVGRESKAWPRLSSTNPTTSPSSSTSNTS
jgi:hypothetical protein